MVVGSGELDGPQKVRVLHTGRVAAQVPAGRADARANLWDTIAAAVTAHPDAAIFASIPGRRSVLTGVLHAEVYEDRARFASAAVRLAESGLGPVTRPSGALRGLSVR
jgi:FPC/CPF motif-containing protein YcgG